MRKKSTFTPDYLFSFSDCGLGKDTGAGCSQTPMSKSEVWTIMQNAPRSWLWPFQTFQLNLTSDLRWSTMLFITHLIVNERKCNQQLFSKLYMESRRLLSPEKMRPLMEPRQFLPLPPPFWREGGVRREREELQIWWEYLLRTHCCHTRSPAAKACIWNFDWTAFISSKCGIFSLICLMLTENLSSYSFFSGAAEKQVEGEWGIREEGQKQKEI